MALGRSWRCSGLRAAGPSAAAAAAAAARQVMLPGYGFINLTGSTIQVMLPGYGYIDGV